MSGHAECPCPNCPSPSDCEGATENQQLRGALVLGVRTCEGVRTPTVRELGVFVVAARAALAGTPSEDTE
jgi:hypothetical protein